MPNLQIPIVGHQMTSISELKSSLIRLVGSTERHELDSAGMSKGDPWESPGHMNILTPNVSSSSVLNGHWRKTRSMAAVIKIR